jgi:hypothetical protein
MPQSAAKSRLAKLMNCQAFWEGSRFFGEDGQNRWPWAITSRISSLFREQNWNIRPEMLYVDNRG